MDLIYRQAVISEMKKMYDAAEKWLRDANETEIEARAQSCMSTLIEIKLRIEKMPSAEPELATNLQQTCNQLATDCISRQAAINIVSNWLRAVFGVNSNANTIGVFRELRALPSAEPETAKRIVGKSRDGMTLWYQCDMCNEPVDEKDKFCRGCGRRLVDE